MSDLDLDFLAESIRIAANELHHRKLADARLVAIVDDHFTHVARSARTEKASAVRAAVLKGLSCSSLPSVFIRNFEAAFWDAYPQTNAALSRSPGRSGLRDWLHGRVPCPKLDHNVGLGLNSIPYGEAGLFRLLSIILLVGWGFRLNIVYDDYSEVGASLTEGSLSLAVHNSSLLRQLKLGADRPLPVLASPPLLTFRNYDVLASQAALRACLGDAGLGEDARAVAARLLEGGMLDPAAADGEAAVALIRRHGIYFLKNTDTQDVALTATGARLEDFNDDEDYVVSTINPDEGLERLLDGRVILYFGGAIQSNYALKNCANRASLAGRVERATQLQFYIAEAAYADPGRKQTYDFILRAWNVTKEVWKALRDERHVPRQWTDARRALRDEIMIEVNRPQDMPNGFVSSFDDLFDLIKEHDIIHDMPDQAHFDVPLDPTASPLVDLSEVRKAL
ncbi:hypothetical protein [Sphingosinicella sp.]|uniref:hypothetical protein n=1 Tax=Sphingosinicella sp. TaxID=1917971 RepID=UPI0040384B18